MKNYLLIICLGACFHCCKVEPYEKFSAFPSEQRLVHQPMMLKGLADPNRILLLDDALVIQDSKSDFWIHMMNPSDYSPLGSFIRKGRGPSEEMIIQTMRKISGNQFYYKTLTHIKFFEYDSAHRELVPRQTIPVLFDDLIEAFMLKEGVYGWNRNGHEKEFVHYQEAAKLLDFGADYPMPERGFSPGENIGLYSNKQVTVRPDKQMFAAVYMYFPFLRIYDSAGQLQKEVRFENGQPFPDYLIDRNADRKNVKPNYWFIKSTSNYLYALYAGSGSGEPTPGTFGNEIHVYDWQGNPVRKIITDKALFNFDVSADDRLLIGFSKNDPDHLYKYKL